MTRRPQHPSRGAHPAFASALVALLLAAGPACVGPQNLGHALLGAEVHGTLVPGRATPAPSPRTGEASSWSWLFLFAGGDASIEAAMAAGGITTVHRVESRQHLLLAGLGSQFTTIVHGE